MSNIKHLNEGEMAVLSRLYSWQPLSADKLPYTVEFDKLVTEFNNRCPETNATHYDLYNTLIRLRKGKKLLRKTKRVI